MNPTPKPHNPDNVQPGEGYRLLNEGETILRDDEVLASDGSWVQTLARGTLANSTHHPIDTYRRRLPTPTEHTIAATTAGDPLPEAHCAGSIATATRAWSTWMAKKPLFTVPYPFWIALKDSSVKLIPDSSAPCDWDEVTHVLRCDTPAPPPKSAPVGPTVNGYVASYTTRESCVKFGCANIPVSLLREARFMMRLTCPVGNRWVSFITLSSGVTLNRGQIDSILTYVDEVDQS